MQTPIWRIKTFSELKVDELYNILKLRNEVFIVEQNCPYQDIDDADQKALHLWCEINEQTCAYCRLFQPGTQYPEANIGRVITSSNYRGIGLGKDLMTLAIETIKTKYSNPKIRIAAQNYALKFYENLGFKAIGDSFLEDNIPHSHMILTP